ncbi:DUF2523 family protein [Stutzerimonas kirkiae]|uniref:DUF2523 family protein n=1 Tax=Stutzerimonas kirkiae TaxID=2211392 RepID=UPI0010384D16|nr:DUF2523 family protein [Stutzerimonas kirkiae]TBV13212.1 Head virion protein G6P [Stutzerimonas kirkiae]
MGWISGFLDQILVFLQAIWDFVANGIYDLVRDAFVVLTKVLMYSYLQTLIFLIDVAFTVAMDLIESFGIADLITSSFNRLPVPIAQGFAFFGIPQALNIIFSALATRFCMRFVPFIGR